VLNPENARMSILTKDEGFVAFEPVFDEAVAAPGRGGCPMSKTRQDF
jgi:hypothetical protein